MKFNNESLNNLEFYAITKQVGMQRSQLRRLLILLYHQYKIHKEVLHQLD